MFSCCRINLVNGSGLPGPDKGTPAYGTPNYAGCMFNACCSVRVEIVQGKF